jgi:integrase
MRAKLIKRTVDASTATASDLWVWDTEIKGFGLRVRPNSRKVYVVEYRPGDGGRRAQKRRFTIGLHGSPWTPESARTEAKRLLALVEQGKDPAAEKQAGKKAETMAEICAKFLTEHVKIKRKGRTADEYKRLIDKFILPALGNKKVKDMARQDVAKLHHKLQATPYQANRVLAVLSKLFNLAEAWGIRPDGTNPCRHVEKFEEQKRERMLSAEELAAFGETLAAYDGSVYAIAAIKLLIFTGARLNEVLGLRWEDVNFENGDARLLDHKTSRKTGSKTLHLPPPAVAVLTELPRIDGNPYVIVGGKPEAHLVNLEKPWRAVREAATLKLWRKSKIEAVADLVARLDRELKEELSFKKCKEAADAADIKPPLGMTNVRLHDLRHAFASVAASSGMGLPIIGKLLGHTQAQTTQRYAHLASDPVKAAAATVAGKVAAAMNGNKTTA